jgi:glycerol-3-phosphate dehydrogenase (NAD(P)+)
LKKKSKIAVIGGGSWATAIIKMLGENLDSIYWWMRNEDAINHIKKFGHNPNYISSAELKKTKINITSDINEIVNEADCLILAIPSAFLKKTLDSIIVPIDNKFIVSAIKGIVPENNTIIGDFLRDHHNLDVNNIAVLTGPCHAEEVAMERLSYLTIASQNIKKANWFAKQLSCRYIKTNVSDDIYGTEYAAIIKNIVALAGGICHGLGYGDNFQAVLISNAIREIKRFVDVVKPIERDIKESAYLGDLLVTAYSQFSRNRMFGEMIGRGYSVDAAHLKIKMVVEGYYAVKCIYETNLTRKINMPITEAVYHILYENKSPKNQMRLLSEGLN